MYRPIRVWLLLMLTPCVICHFNLFLLCIFLLHLFFFLCFLLIFIFLIIPIPLFVPLGVANIQLDRQIQEGTETDVIFQSDGLKSECCHSEHAGMPCTAEIAT